MPMLRRFVLIVALMFWQGGFMFYGAVVVPVTRVKLENRPERGIITQRVTQWMNLAGTLTLLIMFADLWAGPKAQKRWRWLAWFGAAIPDVILFWMHHEMSAQMAIPGFHQSDMRAFAHWHQVYLLLSTLQWVAAMVFVWQSLKAWRIEDEQRTGRQAAS